jgi:hypothetical protein
MTPDFLDSQLDPGVLNELDHLGFTPDPVPLTIPSREDAEVRNEAGLSDPTFPESVSFELLPVTLVHDTVGNPDLGITTETEEDKLFRLSVLFLNSLTPSPTQSSKASSLSAGGPTARIQPVTEETRCYCKG